ncbi:MAG TPA: bifunctional 23S rRNA (guanine(2069)-N(7))-methyltransferase RlmK/23S rRNA (guanine(2445)-N(2))-methyltransferase RlmL [Steroidobacteraceae bacterium]|nr:bifunctional 23S rRNA (guanine(2069)-N(7))-methyltransferase RlmK/23S rRNA (guanine(2445)-N(2))-methyltransferase RlmL [Steroidobacteraceae bacterium]
MSETYPLIASCPLGLADLLAAELRALGAEEVRERSNSVAFEGCLAVAYRACLASRIANRILLGIARFEAADTERFYAAARELDWTRHIGAGATLACDFTGKHPTLTHSHFGALRLKDAICDALRATAGYRPDVKRERPSVRVHAHAQGAAVTLAIDLSGESLHRRGYRTEAGEAPLKENVAAGMLIRAGWPQLAAAGAPFLDPLCGSGTLVIEAALIAAHRAPGLLREYFGALGWRGHDAALFAEVRRELQGAEVHAKLPNHIRGQDRDAHSIRIARDNAERAGVGHLVSFAVAALGSAVPAPTCATPLAATATEGSAAPAQGLLCTNPPYGVRLEDLEIARAVHRELGAVLREHFAGWEAAVLTGAPQLGIELGIRAHRTHKLWNGALECRLLRLRVEPRSLRQPGRLARADLPPVQESAGARMFANRLAKNRKRLESWARRTEVSCYRLYDADMPEYAFAIDRYDTLEPPQRWLYVQEYAAPADIDPEAVRRRRREVLASLPGASGIDPEHIRLRTRRRSRGGEQYGKLDAQGRFLTVLEGGLRFQVNFEDYLDTGLFLDHRETRARLRAAARGARFLNLFAYTGTASVYAAAGGAVTTTSVDLSRTYLDWAARNLAANGFSTAQHRLVQADCREWLRAAAATQERFELIFLDPPTFSNSKRMQGVLDIERDHPQLLAACAQLLAPAGLIVFSTNSRRFRLDPALQAQYAVRDIGPQTLPADFARNPRIHRCFELRLAAGLPSDTSSERQGLPSRASM